MLLLHSVDDGRPLEPSKHNGGVVISGDRQRDSVSQGVTLTELPVIQPKVFWHKTTLVYFTCAITTALAVVFSCSAG